METPIQTTSKDFNPNDHLLRITGKDYLPVRWRLVWFHQSTGSRAGYCTFQLELDRQNGFAQFLCVAWDGGDEVWREVEVPVGHGASCKLQVCGRLAMGYGSETRADFNDFPEKSETKAVGRALAGLGFGTQFAPELDEKHRIVDSPVERSSNRATVGGTRAGASTPSFQPSTITRQSTPSASSQAAHDGRLANEQQISSIRKLCAALGREEPAEGALTYEGAGALIRQLSREYNTSRGKQAAPERSLTPAVAQAAR